MLGVIANTLLSTVGCDSKLDSRWRSSLMTICAMTLVAMVVASRSMLRHISISFFSRCMPRVSDEKIRQRHRGDGRQKFPQILACLGARIPCPRRASRASARTEPLRYGSRPVTSEAMSSYSGTHSPDSQSSTKEGPVPWGAESVVPSDQAYRNCIR